MDEEKISNEELLKRLKNLKHTPNHKNYNPPVPPHPSRALPHPHGNNNLSHSSHHKHHHKKISPLVWIFIIFGTIVLLAGIIYLITIIDLPKPENKDVGGFNITYGNPDTDGAPSGFNVNGSSGSSGTTPSGGSDSGTPSSESGTETPSGSSGNIPPPPPLPP